MENCLSGVQTGVGVWLGEERRRCRSHFGSRCHGAGSWSFASVDRLGSPFVQRVSCVLRALTGEINECSSGSPCVVTDGRVDAGGEDRHCRRLPKTASRNSKKAEHEESIAFEEARVRSNWRKQKNMRGGGATQAQACKEKVHFGSPEAQKQRRQAEAHVKTLRAERGVSDPADLVHAALTEQIATHERHTHRPYTRTKCTDHTQTRQTPTSHFECFFVFSWFKLNFSFSTYFFAPSKTKWIRQSKT